ncbi:MAG: TRAP transporter substrate-binding protein [Oscillospiraceae bacterium]|nr:TRAP transporter substrate-binding protein [Oscillospiraceae bacterium]
MEENKMKKFLALTMALCMIFALCAVSASADEPITLTYAEVNPLDGTTVGDMAKAFKEKVEELSGGSVLIDIQASGVLGSEDQILDNLLGGGNICDISRISAFALTQYGCDKASLLSIPYTFVNEDHFWKFADSELAQEFLNEPQEIGLPLRGLCYGEEGFRHFFFKNEVKGLEDLKGLKIRVSSDPVMTGMVTNLGASATSVPFTELYSALNTGVVDGAEQPTANYRSNAFQEVAPYLLLDGHTLGALQIVISDAGWAKLNEEQQGWIMEAAKYASSVCREKVAENEQKTFDQLKEDGATVIPVEDKAPWIEACQPTIKANTEKLADLYQQILDMAK